MNCLDCSFHKVLPDPDPDDWFCDDDVCVACTLTPKQPKLDSKYKSDKSNFKMITVSCRPYRIRKESETPDWCPKELNDE